MRRGSRSAAVALGVLLVGMPMAGAAAGAPSATVGWTVETVEGPSGQAVHHVHMQGVGFSPPDLTVAAGDTVDWHNHDNFLHTATDDGGAWDTGDVAGGATASLTFAADASHTYSCVYHANFGMVGTLEVGAGGGGGNVAPTTTITAPGDGAEVAGTVTVEGTASDADGTVALVEVRIDGGAWQVADGIATWTFSWDTTTVADGARSIEARATDDADAVGDATLREVQVANPPTVAITSPAEREEVRGTVTVTGTAADPGDGGAVAEVEVRIDGGAWQATQGTTTWSFTWDTTGVADGNRTVEARSTDDGGLASDPALVGVVVANGGPFAPEVAFTFPEEDAEVDGVVTVLGTADDQDGTVVRVEVRADGGPWQGAVGTRTWSHTWDTGGIGDGPHTLEARAIDDEDRVSALATRHVQVATRPVVSFTAPADGASVAGQVTVEGHAEDAGDNLAMVEVRVDHGPWQTADLTPNGAWSFVWDTADHADGAATVEARASDDADNVGEVAARTFEVANPPSVAITAPGQGEAVQGAVTITGTASDPGPAGSVATVEVRIGDGAWRAADGTTSWSLAWDTTGQADGPATIEARAHDAGGLAGTTTSEVEVANPPSVAITAPAAGATLEGSVTVAGTASDPGPGGAVAGVEVRVDHGPWQAADLAADGEPWSFAWDTTTVEDGVHTVEARSSDAGGLHSDLATRVFTVDNLRPDLVVQGIAVEGVLSFVRLTATVTNVGDEASPSTEVAFSYRGAGPDEAALGTLTVPALAPGNSADATLQWNHLGKLGSFQVRASADPGDEVREHDEGNNAAEVQVCLPHLDDLGLACLLPPTEVL